MSNKGSHEKEIQQQGNSATRGPREKCFPIEQLCVDERLKGQKGPFFSARSENHSCPGESLHSLKQMKLCRSSRLVTTWNAGGGVCFGHLALQEEKLLIIRSRFAPQLERLARLLTEGPVDNAVSATPKCSHKQGPWVGDGGMEGGGVEMVSARPQGSRVFAAVESPNCAPPPPNKIYSFLWFFGNRKRQGGEGEYGCGGGVPRCRGRERRRLMAANCSNYTNSLVCAEGERERKELDGGALQTTL